MRLEEILKDTGYISANGNTDIDITDIASDSRECVAGCLFIAVKGFQTDGHLFIGQAIRAGAAAVVYQDEMPDKADGWDNIVTVRVNDSRHAVGTISANFFRHPSSELELVGITGTNGKTTIATLLYRLMTMLGYKCGLLSTIANYVIDKKYGTANTTGDPITTNRLLREMADSGCAYCFMEVSSHALHQERVNGLRFKGAIFTNITRDHLDYHKTFEEYIRCKKMLFDSLPSGSFALINSDDKRGKIMVQNCKATVYTYSSGTMADFRAAVLEKSLEGSLLSINGTQVWVRFIGEHNAHNLCAVYGCAILLGSGKEETLRCMSALGPVKGRLEYIKGGRGITAVVDYAHTPDALENVLKTLKPLCRGTSLTAVFGCGGNRDKGKRSEMAAIGAKYADRIIITSDNPRYEKAEDIIEDMKKGIPDGDMGRVLFITDRKEAIRTAIATAPPESIVVVAGKGHEDYQIINGVKHHFDDREVIDECFKQIKA